MKHASPNWSLLAASTALLVGMARPAFAQTGQVRDPNVVAFVEAQAKYRSKPSYRLNVRMASYQGHTSTVPVDTASSTFYRNGKAFYQRSMGTTSIQSSEMLVVKVDEDSTIRIGDMIDVPDPFEMYDDNEAWKLFTSSTARKDGDRTVCVLEMRHPEYERLEYTLDASGWIRRIVLYFREAITDEEGPAARYYRPKVVLDLDVPVAFDAAKEKWRFNVGSLVRFGKTGAVSSVAGYRVVDMRLP